MQMLLHTHTQSTLQSKKAYCKYTHAYQLSMRKLCYECNSPKISSFMIKWKNPICCRSSWEVISSASYVLAHLSTLWWKSDSWAQSKARELGSLLRNQTAKSVFIKTERCRLSSPTQQESVTDWSWFPLAVLCIAAEWRNTQRRSSGQTWSGW